MTSREITDKEILSRKRYLKYKRLQYIELTIKNKKKLLDNYSNELPFLKLELKNIRRLEIAYPNNSIPLRGQYDEEIALIEERIQLINRDSKSLKIDLEKLEKQLKKEQRKLNELILVLERLSLR